ncbi:MAG TPA: GSU2403 family nucleotidyltransferase fold protein [Vicinamibacteria bacterium]|nr:GSU2403 family nucleotidyltransferase fold protein [Vicinamibacteria bacterium]
MVVVGGWAHRLHRFHPLAKSPGHLPLRTRDADLAFSRHAVLDGDVRAALGEAGFREERLGEHRPPVTHYHLGEEDEGIYAEFLTSLHGDGLKRDGTPDATVSKAGITAQKLRYLDLLLVSAWGVRVGPGLGVPVSNDLELLVPNPVSFIVQKLLIHSDRSGFKKAQDVLYIHDTLELFGTAMDEMRVLWADEVRPKLPTRTARRAARTATELFHEVTDTIREAARMPQDRQPSAERIRVACEYGLGQIMGRREPV